MKRLSLLALLFLATVALPSEPQQPMPAPLPPKAPTVADVLKDKADAEAAIAKAKATFDAWKREAAKVAPEMAKLEFSLGVGKQGPPGLSAYEVAKKNGFTGTEAEWLASLKGERGPQGIQGPPGPPAPGPPPIVDPFVAAIQAAYSDPMSDKTALPAVAKVLTNLLPYVDTAKDSGITPDSDTGQLFTRYNLGFKGAMLNGKLPLVMDVINKPLFDLMGANAQPLTTELRAAVKGQINKTLDALKAVR